MGCKAKTYKILEHYVTDCLSNFLESGSAHQKVYLGWLEQNEVGIMLQELGM